ncbi:hypothetical protein GKE62_16690 [Novosphingobium sp. Gsoil 351]|nr:hypothetical protein GKE62_16690 [Novosphingobium sp. Gsoil 351]
MAGGFAPRRFRALDAESAFFARYATGLAIFIFIAFAQFDLRGMAPLSKFGWEIHAHAAVMVAWLGLTVAQPWLAASGNRALHRRLGWISLVVLATLPVVGSLAGTAALRDGIVPPFFTPAYFLALVNVGVVLVAAMVLWAVALRRRSDWHRRLMIGSTALLLEPALGRTLPMPLMGGWGEWVALAIQLGALAFLVGHDRRTLARVHPATLAAMLVIVIDHLLVETLSQFPPMIVLAAGIAGA